jgi:hypothetical protein
MAKLTKTQKKKLVTDILNKTKKLFMQPSGWWIVSTKDMDTIEKLCAKFMKRIG